MSKLFHIRQAVAAVFLLLLALQAPSLSATQAEGITMNMRNADVRTVIQWMAEITGRNFIVDPQVSGTITVLSTQTLAPDQAFDVFVQALAVNGLTADVDGNTVSVTPTAKSSNSNMAVLDSFDGHADSEKAVHIIQTHSVSAANVVAQLQPLIGESGRLSNLGASNSILIADRVDNIKRIRTLIERLDQRGSVDLDVFRLQHVQADKALRSLQQLMPTETANKQLGLASDERSNSILISGAKAQRTKVKGLLKRLDHTQLEQGRTEVVRMQFMSATELVPILEGLQQARSANDSQPGSTISVQASESANALILTAPAPVLTEMKRVIAEIDVQRRQVLLEAVIVEVSDEFVNSFGVQWNTDFNGSGTDAATEFGLDQIETITNNAGDIVEQNSILGNGFTLGYYRDGSLRALMNALNQSNDANLLSTPSIVALDNEQAEILVGSNVPLITGTQTSQATPTTDPFTTVERHDIGVSLQVTPKINQQGSITLDIVQKVESISNSDIARDLILDKRSIKTKVLVEDNEVLVLGGLTRQDNREIVERVPVLGYIPILGKLFQRSEDQVVRRNLMVFIHPRILDKKSERHALTQQKEQTMRGLLQGEEASPLLENFDINQSVAMPE